MAAGLLAAGVVGFLVAEYLDIHPTGIVLTLGCVLISLNLWMALFWLGVEIVNGRKKD